MIKKILFIVLGIWIFIFLIDFICIRTIDKPIFMIKIDDNNNDVTLYYGLLYKAIDYGDDIDIGSYFMKIDDSKALSDSEKFKNEYSEVSDNNVFVYRSIDEIINILKNGTGVVYLGFPECKWCQSYVDILDEVANEIEIDKIYYCDILEDRENNSDSYQELVAVLEDELQYDEEGNKRIYVPHVSFVIEGEIIGSDYETSKDTLGLDDPNEYWSDDRIASLKDKLSGYMKEVYDATMMCTECNS